MKLQVITLLLFVAIIEACKPGDEKPKVSIDQRNKKGEEKIDSLSWAYQTAMQVDSIKKGLRKTYYRDTLNRIIPDSIAIEMIATGDYEVWPSLMDLKLWPRALYKKSRQSKKTTIQ